MFVFSRLPYPQREIRPLDEWEILPEQIEIEEELGRGAFGVVYKATFRKRVGMEVFDAEITKRTLLSDKKPPQVVAVKGLHGKKYCSLTKDKATKVIRGAPNYLSCEGIAPIFAVEVTKKPVQRVKAPKYSE